MYKDFLLPNQSKVCPFEVSELHVTEDVTIQSNNPIVVSGDLHIVGDKHCKVTLICTDPKQPCIGPMTNTNNSTGSWQINGSVLNAIRISNVDLILINEHFTDFTVGTYGLEYVPELVVDADATLVCPELRGLRARVETQLYTPGTTQLNTDCVYKILHPDKGGVVKLTYRDEQLYIINNMQYQKEMLEEFALPEHTIAQLQTMCDILYKGMELDEVISNPLLSPRAMIALTETKYCGGSISGMPKYLFTNGQEGFLEAHCDSIKWRAWYSKLNATDREQIIAESTSVSRDNMSLESHRLRYLPFTLCHMGKEPCLETLDYAYRMIPFSYRKPMSRHDNCQEFYKLFHFTFQEYYTDLDEIFNFYCSKLHINDEGNKVKELARLRSCYHCSDNMLISYILYDLLKDTDVSTITRKKVSVLA